MQILDLLNMENGEAVDWLMDNQNDYILVKSAGEPIGLCDSKGVEFCVGSIVRRATDINSEMHGEWVDYEVKLQGTTPLLTYLQSDKGQVLPVGYTACCLCNEYDHKMFVFATESKSLRPMDDLIIQST